MTTTLAVISASDAVKVAKPTSINQNHEIYKYHIIESSSLPDDAKPFVNY
jgi:hypothetical protein